MNKKQTGIVLILTLVLMATIVSAMGLSLVGSKFAPRYEEIDVGKEVAIKKLIVYMPLSEALELIIFTVIFLIAIIYMIWREINAQHSNS